MSERMSLVPGARIRLTSKAGVNYEGKLAEKNDEEGTIAVEHVMSFGTADENLQASVAAAHIVYGYVVFRQTELKEIKVLETTHLWIFDSAIAKVVEDCAASRARKFSNEVLSWIQEGETEKLSLVLENSHLHDTFDPAKKTLLHYAAEYNNALAVEKLLSMGANVNAQDSMGRTPLMMAMEERRKDRKRDWAAIRAILAAGADVFILNSEKKSALHVFCADHGDFFFSIGRQFFEQFKKTCSRNNGEVDSLIDAGCSLHMAYEYTIDLRLLELLLKRDLPVVDSEGSSVFNLAMERQDVKCVELLLTYGASVNEEDDAGDTPWSLLGLQDFIIVDPKKEARIVQLFLQHGASPTAISPDGAFHGMPILENGQRDAIRKLLEYNLDFTAVDEHRKCVLHYLALNYSPGVVGELKCFEKSLNVHVRDRKGATPLHAAAKSANTDMLAFFLSMGADVNCRTTEGCTPLYYTCTGSIFANPMDQCTELLLQRYADPQFIVTKANGQQITVFEAASTAKNLNWTKPFVAQMAVLEGLGTPITDVIRRKISSYPALEEYLSECRRILRQEIAGSVTLFKLLPADKRKMARFLENDEFSLKVEGFMGRLKSTCSHYYNWLKARHSEGASYKMLRGEAARVICSVFKKNIRENVNENNLIIDVIIGFLDEESLAQMSKVSKA